MKFVNFVKKHKIALIVVSVCIVLIILLYFAIKNTFFANMSKSKYGNRLDGIEKYPIENSLVTDISNGLKENEIINSVSYDLEGRIINFTIEIKDEVELATAKEAATKVLEYFKVLRFMKCSLSLFNSFVSFIFLLIFFCLFNFGGL